jgi:hypothetical protein
MKDIIISESTIRKALRQSINEMMDEDRIELPNGAVEIDNFENIREMMKFDNPGDTIYFVQLMKRDKDNPGQHSPRNAAQYIKNYFFKSIDEFNAAEKEIKYLCASERARACIFLNPRSKAVIDKYTSNYLRRVHGNRDTAMAIAAGRSFDNVLEGPERSICFVDVDSADQNDINMTMKIIQDAGITPLFAYRSMNNGIHIILPDKEAAKKLDFTPLTGDLSGLRRRAKLNAKVSLEIDKSTLLYAFLKPQGYGAQDARFARLSNQKNNNRRHP